MLLLFVAASPAWAQHQPYKVYDTRPVIVQGPYLVAMSDTTATIVWMTDTPSHSKVRYGTGGVLSHEAEPHEDGLLPVGTLHTIHLTDLDPGQTYQYQVVSTRVVKLNAYWPDKGLSTESPVYDFTTFDPTGPTASFSFVTDTHEDVRRIGRLMGLIDWEETDFLAHGGDAFHWIDTEEHIFRSWLGPTSKALEHRVPLLFARGNHELRGPFARNLFEYIPTPEGRYYYTRDHGPLHLVVLDSGEDKPDDTNVYAGLNRLKAYMEEQFEWLREHVRTSDRLAEAPFRVVLVHQSDFGWVDDENEAWIELANEAGVDLVISGHWHRFARIDPGESTRDYHTLVVGQDQLARIDATSDELRVTVVDDEGAEIDSFTLTPREGRTARTEMVPADPQPVQEKNDE